MTSTERFFVSLISAHLNNSVAEFTENIDYTALYSLAADNGVMGIIASEIMKLPPEKQPDENLLSTFKQQIGYTLIEYVEKKNAYEKVVNIFESNSIDYIVVKGYVLKDYYPVKEFRTGGDIDFIIRQSDLDKCKNAINVQKISASNLGSYGLTFDIDGKNIEIHTQYDCDHNYFIDVFDLCYADSNRYILPDKEHILYVLCHIIKHMKEYGAGIKMFMDIDVLIRHIESFNYEEFIEKCKELKIDKFAKSAFSLCNYWFCTPICAELNPDDNTELWTLFENEIIEGGSFGYSKRGLGDLYLNKVEADSKYSKFKAFLKMIFPDAAYLKQAFAYADKHSYLLPLAWFHRLLRGIFKRRNHSVDTIRQIANADEKSIKYRQLLEELGI